MRIYREAQADVPVPLFIPDQGAWPRLPPVHGFVMRGNQPSLGGLAEVGLDLLQGFALGIAAWQRRHLGRITSGFGLGVDKCRQGKSAACEFFIAFFSFGFV